MEFPTSNDPLYHSKTLDAFRFQTQQLNQLYTWNNHIRLNVRPISYDMFFPKQQEHLNTSKRYWSQEEHALFVKAIEYLNVHSTKGLPVKIISRFVGTRTPVQVRTHAQKYFECEAKDIKNNRKRTVDSSLYELTTKDINRLNEITKTTTRGQRHSVTCSSLTKNA